MRRMSAPLLQLRGMVKAFDGAWALRGIDFDLRAGEVHALLGENGAGKSTLIKIVTGAIRPDAGRMELFGHAVSQLDPRTARGLGVACIYQQPALFGELSVAENIALRLEPPIVFRRVRWGARREQARELLASIGAEISPEAEIRALSMPEQQLVEIACAIGAGAQIVIMDEPTASLTQKEQELLWNIVRGLRARGVGVVYITHRLEEIFALADRVTVLRDGENVGTHPIGVIDEAGLIRMMIGREMEPNQKTHDPNREWTRMGANVGSGGNRRLSERDAGDGIGSEVALALRGVGYAGANVHGVTFEVRAGEVFGLAGLVGSGRTELARILFGLTPADAGEIRLHGRAIAPQSPAEAIGLGIAYMPEDRRRHGVIPEMPVSHNTTLAIHRQLFPGAWLRLGAERSLALGFMRDLAIKCAGPEAPVSQLSGGNQQKVALARWLAAKPRLLILDEPTQGVDVGAKAEIHQIIRRLAREGLAIILISSDLPEIIRMGDRIGVMRGGALAAVLPGGSSADAIMAAALGREGKGAA
jgi:rhamnose transport system ATP-binding protein